MRFLLLIALSLPVLADNHSKSEKEVLEALYGYFEARNSQDYKAAMSFESNNGTYNTNSDGSFHKPILIETLEQRSQNPQSGITNIYYPEAIELSKDVVHVRFYSEGIYGGRNSSGPYRTRVTMNWIKEGGKWVVKTQHYSPAVYGGVHMPDAYDFQNYGEI